MGWGGGERETTLGFGEVRIRTLVSLETDNGFSIFFSVVFLANRSYLQVHVARTCITSWTISPEFRPEPTTDYGVERMKINPRRLIMGKRCLHGFLGCFVPILLILTGIRQF